MAQPLISFIGGGNMARSMIGGLVAGGHPPERIRVSDPGEDKRAQLAADFGVEVAADSSATAAAGEVVVLAVKPQVAQGAAEEIAPGIATAGPLVISVAAGIRQAALGRWLAYDGPIVRCMPNTPALIRAGTSALHANAAVSADQRTVAESIIAATGRVIWIDDESQMDIVTAISGSGPAYFFAFMEALEAAGVRRGLTVETARELVLGTALGAARMATESDDDPATLRTNVTSPGGVTAAALGAFEAGDLAGLVDRAIDAGQARSRELGDEMGGA